MLDTVGNVNWVKNMIFKDTGKMDKKERRPCMVCILTTNKYAYYLSMWTNNNTAIDTYTLYPDWNVLIYSIEEPGLSKNSLVNLKYIYRSAPMPGNYHTKFKRQTISRIKKELKRWQKDHPDEYYDEIKDLL